MCQERFRDGGSSLFVWADPEVVVVCPRCSERAVVRRVDTGPARRLSCAHCAFAKDSLGTTSCWGEPVDPWFGVPLWLRADFRGHALWAYNAAHLTELRAFVAAGQRERTPSAGAPMTMLEKLPVWMTSAKNRDDVVRVLDRLVTNAGQSAPTGVERPSTATRAIAPLPTADRAGRAPHPFAPEWSQERRFDTKRAGALS